MQNAHTTTMLLFALLPHLTSAGQGTLAFDVLEAAMGSVSNNIPTSLTVTWTPDPTQTTRPKTLTLDHDGHSPWACDSNNFPCTVESNLECEAAQGIGINKNEKILLIKTKITAAAMEFTFNGNTGDVNSDGPFFFQDQAPIIIKCQGGLLAANPSTIATLVSAVGNTDVDTVASAAATYWTVTVPTLVGASVTGAKAGRIPSSITLRMTPTTAIAASSLVTFVAYRLASIGSNDLGTATIWYGGQLIVPPICEATQSSSAIPIASAAVTSAGTAQTMADGAKITVTLGVTGAVAGVPLSITCSGSLDHNPIAETWTRWIAKSVGPAGFEGQSDALFSNYGDAAALSEGYKSIASLAEFDVVMLQQPTGVDGTIPMRLTMTFYPNTDDTAALSALTIRSTSTEHTPIWSAKGDHKPRCSVSQFGVPSIAITRALVSDTVVADRKDQMLFVISGAAATAPQKAIVLTCTSDSLAPNPMNPAAVVQIATKAVPKDVAHYGAQAWEDEVPKFPSTYSTVTAMTSIDGDVDDKTATATPTKITLSATPTTAISNGGFLTFRAHGADHGAKVEAWATAGVYATTCTLRFGDVATEKDVATSETMKSNPSTGGIDMLKITFPGGLDAVAAVPIVATCTGGLAPNLGNAGLLTTFTAASSTDLKTAVAVAGWRTISPQGIILLETTHFATGLAGATPKQLTVTFTPYPGTTVALSTLTLSSTGASPWVGVGDHKEHCSAVQGSNALLIASAIVSTVQGVNAESLASNTMTLAVSGTSANAQQLSIVITCSTAALGPNPPTMRTIATTAVSNNELTPSIASTFHTTAPLRDIDGDVSIAVEQQTAARILLRATPTTAVLASAGGSFTFQAHGGHTGVWSAATADATTVCTAKQDGEARAVATTTTSKSDAASALIDTITITFGGSSGFATTNTPVEFNCAGGLAPNAASAGVATKFTATSTSDTQNALPTSGFITRGETRVGSWLPFVAEGTDVGSRLTSIAFGFTTNYALYGRLDNTINLVAEHAIFVAGGGNVLSCALVIDGVSIAGALETTSAVSTTVLTLSVAEGKTISPGALLLTCTVTSGTPFATTAAMPFATTFSISTSQDTQLLSAQSGFAASPRLSRVTTFSTTTFVSGINTNFNVEGLNFIAVGLPWIKVVSSNATCGGTSPSADALPNNHPGGQVAAVNPLPKETQGKFDFIFSGSYSWGNKVCVSQGCSGAEGPCSAFVDSGVRIEVLAPGSVASSITSFSPVLTGGRATSTASVAKTFTFVGTSFQTTGLPFVKVVASSADCATANTIPGIATEGQLAGFTPPIETKASFEFLFSAAGAATLGNKICFAQGLGAPWVAIPATLTIDVLVPPIVLAVLKPTQVTSGTSTKLLFTGSGFVHAGTPLIKIVPPGTACTGIGVLDALPGAHGTVAVIDDAHATFLFTHSGAPTTGNTVCISQALGDVYSNSGLSFKITAPSTIASLSRTTFVRGRPTTVIVTGTNFIANGLPFIKVVETSTACSGSPRDAVLGDVPGLTSGQLVTRMPPFGSASESAAMFTFIFTGAAAAAHTLCVAQSSVATFFPAGEMLLAVTTRFPSTLTALDVDAFTTGVPTLVSFTGTMFTSAGGAPYIKVIAKGASCGGVDASDTLPGTTSGPLIVASGVEDVGTFDFHFTKEGATQGALVCFAQRVGEQYHAASALPPLGIAVPLPPPALEGVELFHSQIAHLGIFLVCGIATLIVVVVSLLVSTITLGALVYKWAPRKEVIEEYTGPPPKTEEEILEEKNARSAMAKDRINQRREARKVRLAEQSAARRKAAASKVGFAVSEATKYA